MASDAERGRVPARLEPDGAEAFLVAFDGHVLSVDSPRPFAPGAPVSLAGRTADGSEGSEHRLEGRTIGSRRREDGRFEVRLRLVNLRRATRLALMASLV